MMATGVLAAGRAAKDIESGVEVFQSNHVVPSFNNMSDPGVPRTIGVIILFTKSAHHPSPRRVSNLVGSLM